MQFVLFLFHVVHKVGCNRASGVVLQVVMWQSCWKLDECKFLTVENRGIYLIIQNIMHWFRSINDCNNMLFPEINKVSVHISTV